jgi:hypothetical protein
MVAVISILSIIILLVSLGCWIFTLVKLFQAGKTLEGVLSICPLVGFIIGWVRANELDHKTIMLIWTACIVANIVLNILVRSQAQATVVTY